MAAEPPAVIRISETVSLAGLTVPSGRTPMSSTTSPTTRIIGCGPGQRDLAGDPDVVLGDLEVDREAGAAGQADDGLQQERRDLLARQPLLVGHPQGFGEGPSCTAGSSCSDSGSGLATRIAAG